MAPRWQTPHVSGVAALLWSANPAWTNVQIREAMAATALDLGDAGWDMYYGYGLVQAYDALDYLGGTDPGPTPGQRSQGTQEAPRLESRGFVGVDDAVLDPPAGRPNDRSHTDKPRMPAA